MACREFLAILIGIAAGVLAGAINGTLVTRVGLPPFIVTLGTLGIFTAVALLYLVASRWGGGRCRLSSSGPVPQS